jgi:hypothetical protein
MKRRSFLLAGLAISLAGALPAHAAQDITVYESPT